MSYSGRPPDAQHAHRAACEDCGREAWLGRRGAALAARDDDLVIRCIGCDAQLGTLVMLRVVRPAGR